MSLKQIFYEKEGKPSIKRITGFIMIANGILGTNVLALTAIFKEIGQYDKIDASFNGLMWGGIALIFGSVADKYINKKDV